MDRYLFKYQTPAGSREITIINEKSKDEAEAVFRRNHKGVGDYNFCKLSDQRGEVYDSEADDGLDDCAQEGLEGVTKDFWPESLTAHWNA